MPGGAAGAASAGKKGAPELARAIGQHFGCHVCVTAGGDGAALWDCDLKAAFSHAGCKARSGLARAALPAAPHILGGGSNNVELVYSYHFSPDVPSLLQQSDCPSGALLCVLHGP